MINEFAASVLVLMFSSIMYAYALVKDVRLSWPLKMVVVWVLGGIFFCGLVGAYSLARFLGSL